MPVLDSGAIDALVERVRERAAEAEELRRLPEPTIVEAERAGLLDLVTPPAHGGRGGGLRELADITRRLAHGCASSAWTLSFLSMHNWLLSRFPERAQGEFWRDRSFVMAPAPLAPGGTAEPVEGGLRVTGEWAWATGVMHADWVIVHVVVDAASADIRFAALPAEEVTIHDIWHTAGMRGTGSNTVVVSGGFVPHHRTVSTADFMAARPGPPDPSYALGGYPVIPVLCLMAAAPALGSAERCVEIVAGELGERVLAYTLGERQADKPAAQVRIAAALARVRAARAYWDDAIGHLESRMAGGGRAHDRRASRVAAGGDRHGARGTRGDRRSGRRRRCLGVLRAASVAAVSARRQHAEGPRDLRLGPHDGARRPGGDRSRSRCHADALTPWAINTTPVG